MTGYYVYKASPVGASFITANNPAGAPNMSWVPGDTFNVPEVIVKAMPRLDMAAWLRPVRLESRLRSEASLFQRVRSEPHQCVAHIWVWGSSFIGHSPPALLRRADGSIEYSFYGSEAYCLAQVCVLIESHIIPTMLLFILISDYYFLRHVMSTHQSLVLPASGAMDPPWSPWTLATPPPPPPPSLPLPMVPGGQSQQQGSLLPPPAAPGTTTSLSPSPPPLPQISKASRPPPVPSPYKSSSMLLPVGGMLCSGRGSVWLSLILQALLVQLMVWI